ncbi:MAG: hypothetical protein ABIJ48_07310 [Actinomycetota bacterium]
MRRLILFAGFLVLVASACGDDDAAPTTAARGTTVVTATTTATTPATAPSTTAVTATTVDPAAPRVALALIFAGEWEGEWVNTTYGSTGRVALAIAVDTEARTATLTIDLGGSVFGAGDPAAFDFVADLAAASPFIATTPLLGEATLEVEPTGAFTLEARDVPEAGIESFRVAGTATSAGIALAYTVGLEDGGSAEGTATLRRPTQ